MNATQKIEQRKVRAGDLHVDPEVQRQTDQKAVKKISGGRWDDGAAGTILVSQRDDGMYVMDGWTRTTAALNTFGPERELDALVYHGLDKKREAQLFGKYNRDRRPVRPVEQYPIDLAAEQPEAMAIKNIMQRSTFRIGKSQTANTFDAIMFIRYCYRDNPAALEQALRVIATAWPESVNGRTIGNVMVAIFQVVNKITSKPVKYHAEMYEHLTNVVQDRPPRAWNATPFPPSTTSRSRPRAISLEMATQFNKGRKGPNRRITIDS